MLLSDVAPEHVRTATGLGPGGRDARGPAQLVVVAVPPDHLADAIVAALGAGDAVVTDVGSVKAAPLARVAARVDAAVLARYVGSHPMAGSERSGPLAASAALFDGRPWAVTPHAGADAGAVASGRRAGAAVRGSARRGWRPEEHDRAVARTSHLPHLAAVLVAGRLAGAPPEHLALSGQGVRDVTRVAAGDPVLWQQILGANAGRSRTCSARSASSSTCSSAPSATATARRWRRSWGGVAGTRAIPGKHGGPVRAMRSVFVSVPDHPGELARLFGDAGEIGVNIEDVHIDHDPGRPVGLTELVVLEDDAEHLLGALESRGWTTHR